MTAPSGNGVFGGGQNDHPNVPPELFSISVQAVTDSAGVNHHDRFIDPVNYQLGMWGKLIILGSVKRQGMKEHINPERDYRKLDWRVIFHEVFDRTPDKLKDMLSEETIFKWFENRMRIYKEIFPTYSFYESAIDQLIRHYSFELVKLKERVVADSNRIYWENTHVSSDRVDTGESSSLTKDHTKVLLLRLLGKFTEGQGIVWEMSHWLSSLETDIYGPDAAGSCDFTLAKIEKKIAQGEIADVKTLVNHCRCLVGLCILNKSYTKVPKPIVEFQESLKKAADHKTSNTAWSAT